MPQPPTVVLSCGEPSGDLHAAAVVARLRERSPGVRVEGLGGERCAAAGAVVHHDYRDVAVLGFTGVVSRLPALWRLERAMRRRIARADLFLAVDYPGLNLRLAAWAHRRGVPVVYYIAPQVWAWGERRTARIARTVDRLAVILPFEEAFFRERGVRAEFVGHPLVVDHPLPPPLPGGERRGTALLPGSREQEVRRILPVLLEAAAVLGADRGGPFVVARSPAVPPAVYEAPIAAAGVDVTVSDDAVDVMRRARAAMVASGTATLQCALLGTPLVVVYRVSRANYALARRLVRIHSIGLVNVVLGGRVCPEFVQDDARPRPIAEAVGALLEDGPARAAMTGRLAGLRDHLGGGRGADRVAEIVAEAIAARRGRRP